jgi:hypothetical protein
MKELSLRQHVELAFRRKLFKLVDRYLSFPEDATLGEIIRTLVNFSDIVSALDRSLCPASVGNGESVRPLR